MNYFLQISDLKSFALITIAILVIVVIRYFVAAGIFFQIFYKNKSEYWRQRRVNKQPHKKGQYRREIKWSVCASLIFAIAGTLIIWLWQNGYARIYENFQWTDIIYIPISLMVTMFLHETYYYWIHKGMHHHKLFKHIHKVHHESLVSSPWTAFSFHPLEALLEAIILPVILIVIPMHLITILVYLVIMTVSSVINHLDIEIYPRNFENHWLGKWIIGATHHSLHHKDFKTNYGLYFTFWDRWMTTENSSFNKLFREKSR